MSGTTGPGDQAAFLSRPAEVTRATSDIGSLSATAPAEIERDALFRANDPDGDGKIDKAGYGRVLKAFAYPEQLDALLSQRDANRDGYVSSAEYRAPVALQTQQPATLAAESGQRRHGTEDMVRKLVEGFVSGQPDYDSMDPRFAFNNLRPQLPVLQARFRARGPLLSVAFSSTAPQGDQYAVTFAYASIDLRLRADQAGKIIGVSFTTLPPTEAQRRAAFAANDKDGDGKLDGAAYRGLLDAWGGSAQLETLFAQHDSDRDGFVSMQEVLRAAL